jgi:hypothetical protein
VQNDTHERFSKRGGSEGNHRKVMKERDFPNWADEKGHHEESEEHEDYAPHGQGGARGGKDLRADEGSNEYGPGKREMEHKPKKGSRRMDAVDDEEN